MSTAHLAGKTLGYLVGFIIVTALTLAFMAGVYWLIQFVFGPFFPVVYEIGYWQFVGGWFLLVSLPLFLFRRRG